MIGVEANSGSNLQLKCEAKIDSWIDSLGPLNEQQRLQVSELIRRLIA